MLQLNSKKGFIKNKRILFFIKKKLYLSISFALSLKDDDAFYKHFIILSMI